MKSIIIFTILNCSHCLELKKKLRDENISFRDVDIVLNKQIWDEVKTQTNHDTVPTVFIQTDDIGNGLVYIPGRDFEKLEEIIEIIKNNN